MNKETLALPFSYSMHTQAMMEK